MSIASAFTRLRRLKRLSVLKGFTRVWCSSSYSPVIPLLNVTLVFRQLEKLSDLFEKLRVSRTSCSNARRLRKYLSPFGKHFACVCAPSEGGRTGSFRPGAETHGAAEVLHERHPGCQGETPEAFLSLHGEGLSTLGRGP